MCGAAVTATPPGHPSLAGHLSDLGVALLKRFEQAGDAADLDAAIDTGRQAVDATPSGHPNLAGRLSNLGNALVGVDRMNYPTAGPAGGTRA